MHGRGAAAANEIEYPSSDGKPMAESDVHRDWMVTLIQRLQRFFAGRRVYVSGNLLIYYVEGDPRKSVAPDTFAVKNCKPGRRDIFKIWTERRRPNFVLETTSKTTRREDRGKKKEIYALMEVPEYFLYDPLGDWLKPPLHGFRLRGGVYEPITPEKDGSIVSQELGVRFVLENGDLAMYDAATGEPLYSEAEWAEVQRQRAEEEHQRAEQERERAEQERERAEEQSRRVQEERQRAEDERRRADEAEHQLQDAANVRKALEQELARLRASSPPPNAGKPRNGK
jgi:Uma2 family endonuclease